MNLSSPNDITEFVGTNSSITWTASGGVPDISWNGSYLGSGGTFSSLSYGNNVYIATEYNSGYCTRFTLDEYLNNTRTRPSMPQSENWLSCAYGNGKFVAAGSNHVASSSDGISWSNVTLPESRSNISFSEVRFLNGIFLITSYVMDGGNTGFAVKTLKSIDAITWTSFDQPSIPQINLMAFGNGVIISIPKYPRNYLSDTPVTPATPFQYSYSTDNGNTWNISTIQYCCQYTTDINSYSGVFKSVVFGNGKFVAMGFNIVEGVPFVATSTDGISWSYNFTASNITSIVYGNGLFYANFVYNSSNTGFAYSSDAINWTTVNYIPNSSSLLCYGNNVISSIGSINRDLYATNALVLYYIYLYKNDVDLQPLIINTTGIAEVNFAPLSISDSATYSCSVFNGVQHIIDSCVVDVLSINIVADHTSGINLLKPRFSVELH